MKKVILSILALSLLVFGAPAAKTTSMLLADSSETSPDGANTHPIQPPV